MITVKQQGKFSKTNSFLKLASSKSYKNSLNLYGARGVSALAKATPKLSGDASGGWYFVITESTQALTITWLNNVAAGTAPLVILLQYGHGTRQGAYVKGVDFINPAMKRIFDTIANEAWKTLSQ